MSTYHLMVKFPPKLGVREARGDQVAAKECYFDSIRNYGQMKRSFTVNVFKTQLLKSDQKLKSRDETWLLMVKE